MSVRSANCLKNDNIIYIGDLVQKSESEMLRTPNFGRKSLNEIKEVLQQMELNLGMSVPDWPPENIDDLAKKYDSDLHVFHLTTEKEMELFTPGKVDGKKITAEVCVHHMYFNESRYADLGNQIKCNPSIKFESDRLALIDALLEDKIDIIATDHAPHTWEEKNQNYSKAPAGLPLVQHGMQILMDFYHQDILSLETIVQKTSHNVANRFQVKDRGYIREGYYADLAVLDLDTPYTVSQDNILYKCGWSPFDGHTFKSSIFMTIVNGNVAFKDGKVEENLPNGMQIEFDR